MNNAVLAEELGFDGFGVGERHERSVQDHAHPARTSQEAREAHRPVIDKVHRCHEQAAVAPVLRKGIPDPPFPWAPVLPEPADR
ncbi:hypothetical protein ACFYZB_11130 [Streptomyces sp. NPDC001852]|uniref:hypothetical protein n=1 Tax=Streptomyces sp. NPDC001852 TaxID=3364619 RepID=UPI0036B7FBCD